VTCCSGLLISGSEVRVLHGPPSESATSGAPGVADAVFSTTLVVQAIDCCFVSHRRDPRGERRAVAHRARSTCWTLETSWNRSQPNGYEQEGSVLTGNRTRVCSPPRAFLALAQGRPHVAHPSRAVREPREQRLSVQCAGCAAFNGSPARSDWRSRRRRLTHPGQSGRIDAMGPVVIESRGDLLAVPLAGRAQRARIAQ
jgi:hypothetical protein